MISVFLNLSRLALWLSMWSGLVNVPCSFEKNAYSAAFAWNGLCCCSVAQLCQTLCDPMDCRTSGFPVLHYLQEFAQTHIHWVDDAIQPSHPVSPFSCVSSPPNVSFKACVFLLIFLSEWSVCWYKWGIKVPRCYLCYCQFLLLCLLTFVRILEVLTCWMHIYNCFVLLLD